MRALSTTTSLRYSDERPKAVRPDSHAKVAVSSGIIVSDRAQQNAKTITGLPRAEEKDLGTFIPPVASLPGVGSDVLL